MCHFVDFGGGRGREQLRRGTRSWMYVDHLRWSGGSIFDSFNRFAFAFSLLLKIDLSGPTGFEAGGETIGREWGVAPRKAPLLISCEGQRLLGHPPYCACRDTLLNRVRRSLRFGEPPNRSRVSWRRMFI